MMLLKLLPYDAMLRELGFEVSSKDQAEPEAFHFYRKVGDLIIQSAQSTHPSAKILLSVQNLLYFHLNGRHAEIRKTITFLQDPSTTIGKYIPYPCHHYESNSSTREPERRSSSPNASEEIPGSLRKSQHICHDYVYTSALKEMGECEGILPHYTSKQISLQPPTWGVTVHYGGFRISAEASSKKSAKHSASKYLWLQMGKSLLSN